MFCQVSYILLNKLMYALFVSGSDDANIPDWKENMEKYKYEIIELSEKILETLPSMIFSRDMKIICQITVLIRSVRMNGLKKLFIGYMNWDK